jgi:hypothetical protein
MTIRYHGVYKKPYIKEGQTTQWPQDTMWFIRSVYQSTDNTMTTRYHGFIRNRISKKDRQYNDHKIPWGL